MRSLVSHWPNGVALLIWTACLLGIGIHVAEWPEDPANRNEFFPILGPDTSWYGTLSEAEKEFPDYRGIFVATMERVEADLPIGLASWKFYVPPDPETPAPLPPPGEKRVLVAALSTPSLALVRTDARLAVLTAAFGDGDRYWAGRALLVWRRSAMSAGWPAEPLVTIRQRGDGKVEARPADAVEIGEKGFTISDRGLPLRQGFVYRALTVAAFRKEGKEGPGPLDKVLTVRPPGPGSGVARARLYDALLGGRAAYAGGHCEEVEAKIPGDVQVRFSGLEPGTKKAHLSLRRFIAGRAEPIVPKRKWDDPKRSFVTQFTPGDRVRAGWLGNIGGKAVSLPVDSQLVLLNVTTREREEIRQRPVTRVNPETGMVETVMEDYVVKITEVIAVLSDLITGGKVTLVKGGAWWPKKVARPKVRAEAAVPEPPRLGAAPGRRGR
ncbi:MAG: hypothetical protein ACYTGB_15555 [Planctomycetota bacterium]|jgi:hypothetical protein